MPINIAKTNKAASFRHLAALVAFVCIATLLPIPAHAYIDPGSGSFLIQALIGAVAVFAVKLRGYARRSIAMLKSLFRAGKK